MRIWLVLGGAAAIGLAGCAVDPYAYGATPQYGSQYGRGYDSGGYGLDPSASATYGEVYLNSGFDQDPYRVWVTSGGSIDAANVSSGCVGMVSRSPDFQLTYEAGSLPLTFGVDGDNDTTLVINDPNGRWVCDDDSGGDTDPEITFRNPQSGTYDVWVGAFGGDSGQGQLFITELGDDYGGYDDGYDNGRGGDRGGNGRGIYDNDNRNNDYERNDRYRRNGSYPDTSATASYGEINLYSGFEDDPYRVGVLAGGDIDASSLGDGCAGVISSAPDFQITYEAGDLPLTIGATSNGDVTLVINGPDGDWYCDDDSGGNNDAEITFRRPQGGTYDVWVGSYGGDSLSAELFFTELR